MPDRLLVLGGRGVVGPSLAASLRDSGWSVTVLGRGDPGVPGVDWLRADLAQPVSFPDQLDDVVHLAPLWLLPGHVDALAAAGARRLVAFSSTSVLAKQRSPDPGERRLATRLADAERACRAACSRAGVHLTVFRPTMVYGFGRDENVARIGAAVRRLRFFPVAGRANGCRQPVHALDLVEATLQALGAPATYGRTYSLSGAELLPFAEMVRRICRGLGMRPRILHVPVALYRLAIAAARRAGLDVSPGIADRMNEDQCFDHADAVTDFGFRPSRFLEYPDRDLPEDASS